MAAKKVRLFKIASEINIGKDTIVEYLQTKGFDIVNKPTTSLDQEMLDLVYDKFKKERRAAEVQRDKIQRHKEIRRVSIEEETKKDLSEEVPKTPKLEKATSKIAAEALEAETEPLSEKAEVSDLAEVKETPIVSEVPTEKAPEIKAESEEKEKIETKSADDEIKPGQVIDLSKLSSDDKRSKSTAKKSRHAKAKTKAKPKDPEPVELKSAEYIDFDELKKFKEDKEAKQQAELAQQEEIKQEAEAKQAEETKSKAAKIKEEAPAADFVKDDSRKTSKKAEDDAKEKAAKETKAEEKHEDNRGLKGLTVLGKIDLDAKRKAEVEKERVRLELKKAKKKKDDAVVEEDDVKVVKKKFKKRRAKTGIEDISLKPSAEKPKVEAVKTTKEDLKKRKKRKKSIREQITDKDVNKAIKETLSGIDSGSLSRAKMKQKRRQEREEKEQRMQEVHERESQTLQLTEFVTTSDLANLMNVNPNELIVKCMQLGLMVTINQRLDQETIELIASDYNYEVEFIDEKEMHFIEEEEDAEEDLQVRYPIVTIMGHVDHGKTSLLDYIRSANVVSTEAGGITQHIAAYRVKTPVEKKFITFLDTPGHEAFTAMRARGAQVTDIVVLVVAADDSVMPQTIEAISHAKAAKVPMVIAINKMDKPDANPDRIRQQLSEHGILVEEWGGKFQSIEISAKKGTNVDTLLEKILLEAELLELKANPDRPARGIVIESNMTKGLGAVSTVIVQKGTMKIGDAFVAGVHYGRVRAMMDEAGNKIESAGPSFPVLVMGFDGLPEAGDVYQTSHSDSEARQIATERKQLRREQELRQVHHTTLDDISAQIQIGGVKELYLIIKGDVAGSVEALSDSLMKLSQDEVKVVILHRGVGSVSETDVMLAAASNAIIIGFNISPSAMARKAAEREKVEIRRYDIIYDCINDVEMALEGLLSPDTQEVVTSEVEIRELFKISKVGTIAGCHVLSGKITRNDRIRITRDGFKVFEGRIASLKRGKDDVREVGQGFECGIQIEGFNDIKEGDIIESFKTIEIKRTLN